ncbi:MAG: hypothetical protein QW478_11310 [Candidatus Micrarchaeaceae archaeon]
MGKRLRISVYGPFNQTQPIIFGTTPYLKADLQNASNTIIALKGSQFTYMYLESFSEQEWLRLSRLTL